MRLGSLCTGIGGLDLAVEQFFGAELAWCAEIDPAASRVLEHRFPGVPNIGNFVGQDPEPVDVLCGGFPCQGQSLAGKRLGIHDERWLFDDICDLVGRMAPRPRVLVFENVRGLLSANDGDAMGRVVHGLARLGYVGSWRVVRASDVGAPHRRGRVFIVAHLADAERAGLSRRGDGRYEAERGETATRPPWRRDIAADASSAGTGRDGRAVPGTAEGARRARRDVPAAVDGSAAAADAEDVGRERCRPSRHGRAGSTDSRFGPYGEAVARWASHLGRTAPDPVDDRRRLSPRFVEFLMGFDEGWCTDVLERRTGALRCLGNAVVPQQALHALDLLAA